MQRLPRGLVLRHRLFPRRLAAGRAPPGVQGAGGGTAGGQAAAAARGTCRIANQVHLFHSHWLALYIVRACHCIDRCAGEVAVTDWGWSRGVAEEGAGGTGVAKGRWYSGCRGRVGKNTGKSQSSREARTCGHAIQARVEQGLPSRQQSAGRLAGVLGPRRHCKRGISWVS